jgi:FixJ family two-component response regulator
VATINSPCIHLRRPRDFFRSAQFSDTSCVITDVQMPAVSGVELQALLLAQCRHVPIIFIRPSPTTPYTRALQAGAICFLSLETALERHGGGLSE